MKTRITLFGVLIALSVACPCLAADGYLKLSVNEYRDKMKGGWIGQIAGVSWVLRPSSNGKTKSFRRSRCRLGDQR